MYNLEPTLNKSRIELPNAHPTLNTSTGLFSAYDLIAMYLAIELQSLCFYVIAALKRDFSSISSIREANCCVNRKISSFVFLLGSEHAASSFLT
jgi:formate hydrogenlyase subunit 3/multisubunit Na+/H+ antiporter MnhD subunit